MLPNLSITVLGEEERECGLQELCAGKIGVIDFWHTKCTRCPAALNKLNTEAEEFSDDRVLFIACAISQGDGNKADVAVLGPESFEHLTHVFVDHIAKDEAKAAFQYTSVPFYVVFNEHGEILTSGEPKSVNYLAEITNALAKLDNSSANGTVGSTTSAQAATPPINVFSLDEDF